MAVPEKPTSIEFRPFPVDAASLRLTLTSDISPAQARVLEIQARALVDGKHKEFTEPARHQTFRLGIQALVALIVLVIFYQPALEAMRQGSAANWAVIYVLLVAIGLPSAGSAATEIIKAIRQQTPR